ncbi:MAG: hypothetical protein HY996_03405 [Micrococcales bacterium]|nr:hypothetical protein [Micrococcales bacterium]
MVDVLRAFPWLNRIRPAGPFLLPGIAAVLAIASVLTVATNGGVAVAAMFTCAAGLGLARFRPLIAIGCLGVGMAAVILGHAWNAYGWMLAFAALTTMVVASAPRGTLRWFVLAPILPVALAIGFVAEWIGFFMPLTLLAGAWAIGFAVGQAIARLTAVQRTEELAVRLNESQLELAVTAERERVGQEVHDVVAHSLAVILAQAEGARALSVKRPAAMTDALDRIAGAARSALLDVRGIVDGLTGGDEPPQPRLDDLAELLRGVEEAGVVVRSTTAGAPRELTAAAQAGGYRIVQEGATNAIRHRGRGSTFDVVLDWRGPGLSIQIVSTGSGDADPAPGVGRGIPGMIERARIAGGWLAAGADESGDHRITAFLPYREAEEPVSA